MMSRISAAGLKSILAHPLTRGLDLDDPKTTELRIQIIQSKPFLRRIYNDWYGMIRDRIPTGAGQILELGAGAGYFREFVPETIASEVFCCRDVHVVADARSLPFPAASLKAIVMTDVFHHIPQADAFLREAVRCLRPGGRIIMVEPWVSNWSKLIYRRLHHEPFLPDADSWTIPDTGPLSGANGALPWMIFVRDRQRLLKEFPNFEIEEIRPMMPLRYLVSGGISMRSLMPAVAYSFWQVLETILTPWMHSLAMFALLSVRRT
jgi:SAM-dependent methyltransferase